MRAFLKHAKSFIQSEDAATATEYAMMITLVLLVVIVAVSVLGAKVSGEFDNAEQQWTAVNP